MLRTIALMLFAGAAFGQASDASLTQTLIDEIRGLRQDMEANNLAVQKVQILLFRLQVQTAIASGAQQRLEAAQARLAETDGQYQALAAQVKTFEEMTSGPIDSAQKAEAQATLPRARAGLESLSAEASARRAAAAEAEERVRAAETRLAELQTVLDRLDKSLDEMSRQKK